MTAASADPQTLDLILEQTKAGPESQLRDVDALDTKAVQVFAAASVVIGLATLVADRGDWVPTALLGGALIAYLVAVYGAITCLWVRDYRKAYHSDTLWPEHWEDRPNELKLVLVDSIVDVYKHNNDIINRKALGCQRLIAATGAEALLVGLAVVVTRL